MRAPYYVKKVELGHSHFLYVGLARLPLLCVQSTQSVILYGKWKNVLILNLLSSSPSKTSLYGWELQRRLLSYERHSVLCRQLLRVGAVRLRYHGSHRRVDCSVRNCGVHRSHRGARSLCPAVQESVSGLCGGCGFW